MIAHDKIIGTMLTNAAGDWAAMLIQAGMAVGVVLIGYWRAHSRK
jgi:hypothetical protein